MNRIRAELVGKLNYLLSDRVEYISKLSLIDALGSDPVAVKEALRDWEGVGILDILMDVEAANPAEYVVKLKRYIRDEEM